MDKLKKIIDRCNGYFLLQTNLHKSNCQTVQAYLQDLKDQDEYYFNKVSNDVINKMIENDSVIHIQLYPDANHISYTLFHYDLDNLIDIVYNVLFGGK